ncbi:MAG: aspartate-semialdehyde dehydrogenase [Fimbriimonadaceae bacterium]|nr:aspartate-semialdehyde dehydrogenase [Fimbriimonadaceae bacterium]
MQKELSVAVIGATGAVGTEIVELIERRGWQLKHLLLYGSSRSAGSEIKFKNSSITVKALEIANYEAVDIALFAADSNIAKEWSPKFIQTGAFVVDNSSAFRMDHTVPLIIPEINLDAVTADTRLVANPNCCTIIMLMVVAPLRKFGKIKRIIVSTYQSASGAGRDAMNELELSTKAAVSGEEYQHTVLPHPYAFNLFSHNTPIGEDGYNGEESKVIQETKKILDDPDILVNPTCIRVPVMRAHSESITIEFEGNAPSVADVQQALSEFPGVKVVDDREGNYFPMPIDASGQDDVLVGRIRQDISNPSAISLFCSGDQLLKGAALNAVQIAEAVFGIKPELSPAVSV